MIKIYSNQERPDVVPMVDGILVNETEWWMIYDAITNKVIVPPLQCAGGASSPFTMVIADSEEELNQYITDNSLILPPSQFDSTYNIE
jgi:hypothetical protein